MTARPKPRYDRAAIAAAAVRLADAEGLDALTMRRVAGALGLATMSLYNYVPAKDHLVQLMIDHVNGEYDYPPGPRAGHRRAVADLARQARDITRRHPWLPQLLHRPPPPGPQRAAVPGLLSRAARGLPARHRRQARGHRADQRLRHHVRRDAGRAGAGAGRAAGRPRSSRPRRRSARWRPRRPAAGTRTWPPRSRGRAAPAEDDIFESTVLRLIDIALPG